MYASGDLEAVLVELGSFDHPFVTWRQSGPPHATIVALARFWAAPELTRLRDAIDAPHFGWANLTAALLDLARGEVTIEVDWADVSRRAAALGRTDRLAGAAASLYALAGWEGAHADTRPLHSGWFTIPPQVSELLLDAGGFRGAGGLNTHARQLIERVVREVYQPQLIADMAPYRQVVARLAARWQEDIAELAWDLRAACGPAEPHLRGGIAALFWITGDAVRAELIADDPAYVPSLGALREMVSASFPGIIEDLLAQHVWLALKDRAPLDLRRHRQLFAFINTVRSGTMLHELDNLMGPSAPARIFAAGLIAHLSRTVPPEIRADLDDAWSAFGAEISDVDPIAGLRFAALRRLISGADDRAYNDRASNDRASNADWADLAADAVEVLDEAVRDWDRTSAQRWLGVPLAYLDDETSLPALERFRAAGLTYRLTMAAPPASSADLANFPLREESELLDELRAAQFILMMPYLPEHYRHFTVDVRTLPGFDDIPDGPTVHADYDAFYDPADGPHPLDPDVARQRIRQAWTDLDTVWHGMRHILPAYARRRIDPYVDLDEFTAALTSAGIDARPIGATPIRRSDHLAAPAPQQPPDHRAADLAIRAADLLDQYQRTDDVDLLGEAIQADMHALALLPQGSPNGLAVLDHLSMMRAVLFLHTGNERHLNDAITGHETAVMQSRAPGIPNELRGALRFNTGMDLMYRYQAYRDLADLERALDNWRIGALLPGLPAPQRDTIYQTYRRGLSELLAHTGDREAIDRAIASIETAMPVTDDDPDRPERH